MPAHIGHLRLYRLSAANCVRLSQAALELRQFALKGFAFAELSSAATLTAEELGASARGLPLADSGATHAQARLLLAHWVVGKDGKYVFDGAILAEGLQRMLESWLHGASYSWRAGEARCLVVVVDDS
ncbi:protein of unknown function [Micropruina glycogenica]|uniref:Uncharacterized protein n=1 Tax=Micropruina glycogenica TaxID=75385 RepID=A0A2N9JI85_9ACTN|nr:protein of unknown function [Micropruina glycogenica]